MTNTFEQLAELSLPLLKHYTDDLLVHDKAFLETAPGVMFIHFTRENGTHIIPMPEPGHDCWPSIGDTKPYLFGHCTREFILHSRGEGLRYIAENRCGPCLLVLFFDGKTLEPVSTTEAVEIYRRYELGVNAAWEGKPDARFDWSH